MRGSSPEAEGSGQKPQTLGLRPSDLTGVQKKLEPGRKCHFLFCLIKANLVNAHSGASEAGGVGVVVVVLAVAAAAGSTRKSRLQKRGL